MTERARKFLDEIKARADVDHVAAALTAVLDLHCSVTADVVGDRQGRTRVDVCDECLSEEYPCPTVAAITSALGGDRG